ncbi:Nuclease-related domain protein [Jeotgalicoccus saudimassiliensis]|uniref:Nuclease-related domain protein n=1 Tax=Jeotgalicoccus saudimassiliensis TaxID=1461582 RepID=A0A078M4N7_9STAP|nr:nuclease-related domain-containing protein [Jeotgalicoccus saudimassiliensis]CEA00317.1 Nuclease-related domain protein [Jeotgalicoccus saudimassiliensis]
MFINERTKPHELLFYEALAVRTSLTKKEERDLSNIRKGFAGEKLYDEIFDETGHGNIIIYRDVFLNIDNSITQFDSLIVSDKGIIANEIKNFTGNCTVRSGNWMLNNFPITKDAFSQLNRSVGKLMDMRNLAQSDFNVSGKIIFPSDTFTFNTDDQTNWNKIILRSGLRDYFYQFNQAGISSGNKAQFISRIISSCIVDNPYFNLEADKIRLKFGLYCGQCGSFNLNRKRFHLSCNKCGCTECNETHLLRAMSDYKFLFYNQPMSRNSLLEFIDNEIPVHTVSRFLNKHCYQHKKGNISHYTYKYFDFDDAVKKSDVYLRYKDKILVLG